MLDQSFSAKNFRIIFDISNRNGFFVEDKLSLSSIRKVTEEIKVYGNLAKSYNKSGNKVLAHFFNEVKEQFREVRNVEIDNVLEEISLIISQSDFKIELRQIKIPGGKDLYTIANKPEYFFAIKQAQFNISRLFGVKQSNRHSIVEQLFTLLNDKFPKTVIRTDISSFYESIDHESLAKHINHDNLLSPKSRKIINSILRSYKILSGSNKGVPRGIGVSAYLSELFMRRIDQTIRSIPGVTYYARFVDDIVVIFTPNPNEPGRVYLNEVKYAIEKNSSIRTNPAKTFPLSIVDLSIKHNFEFLGYEFIIQHGKVKTKLTSAKFDKLEKRTELAFDHYVNFSKVNKKEARKILLKRIRFLTGNTRLANNKAKILIGIYYSNSSLTEMGQIKRLNARLKRQINTRITSASLKKRLNRYDFIDGFENRNFSSFGSDELKAIMQIWK
ncbi:antiviral reverse transcriptase Drt3a [Ulvibacterium marinum]|uniref:antiviral reverse transcriptase Drt3a n=1 Tax=Ulvibacterium marinum TaxID=2419782 RepID=UPI002494BC8B|nr:antiviral reverse transcriptase Drt3a [Ulvibacterium marinum]